MDNSALPLEVLALAVGFDLECCGIDLAGQVLALALADAVQL